MCTPTRSATFARSASRSLEHQPTAELERGVMPPRPDQAAASDRSIQRTFGSRHANSGLGAGAALQSGSGPHASFDGVGAGSPAPHALTLARALGRQLKGADSERKRLAMMVALASRKRSISSWFPVEERQAPPRTPASRRRRVSPRPAWARGESRSSGCRRWVTCRAPPGEAPRAAGDRRAP